MERKTKVSAKDGKQELVITREFDLPVELLFRAYTEPELIGEWMGTKVLKLENRQHGGWQFETTDADGNILFRANGAIHEFSPNQRIVRTFQMENTSFAAQLEFLEFEQVGDERSKLTIQMVFRSVELRDQILKLPFAHGLNMAHDQLQKVADKRK